MNNIPTVTTEIPRYFVAKVNDYHEFDSIKSNLKMAINMNYKYQEIDCVLFDGWHNTGYHAVFWIGKKPSEFIKKYQAENL
tara:strand:- start:178 stop:420 length:243 start_codon:yes stop_codon:yes gene_type:complete